MATITDKKAFFKMAKLKTETVDIGNKNSVIVSELCAADFVSLWTNPEFEGEGEGTISLDKLVPALVASAVVDDAGVRIFSDEDIPKIKEIGQGLFSDIARVARRLNGLGGAVKNSEASQEDDSHSDSP